MFMQTNAKQLGLRAALVSGIALLALAGISHAAVSLSDDIDVDTGIITVSDGEYGTTYISTGSYGTQGDAAGWTPDDDGEYAGIWIEGYNSDDEEAGGFFANTNTAAIWSPGDTDYILSVYDEDDLPDGEPVFGVTSGGGIWVGIRDASPDEVEPGEGQGFFEDDVEIDGQLYLDGSLRIGGSNSAHISSFYSGTADLDFGSIGDAVCADLPVSVNGAFEGDSVVATPVAPLSGFVWSAYVSAVDTVTVRYCNLSGGGATDPVSDSWRVDVWAHGGGEV